jgi:membrane protein YqaA with SNARE-associated domain
MIGIVAVTLGVGFVSAFFPGLPAEPYLIGVVASTSASPVALGLAAAIGQTVGKLAMFLAVRGTVQTPALRGWIAKQRTKLDRRATRPAVENPGRVRRVGMRMTALTKLDKPALVVPILLLSSFVGIPPLILMVFTAAAGKTRTTVFLTTCLTGRCARMLVVALAPGLFIGSF